MAELEKNTAHEWVFKMVDSTDFATPETGLTPTVTVSKDGVDFAALTGSPTVSELSVGWYKVTIAAADMNADVVVLRATGTGAAATEEKFLPPTKIVNDLTDLTAAQVNTECDTAISDAALATAANLTTVDTVVDGIKAVTDLLPDSGALTSLATAAALTTVDTVVDAIKLETDKLTLGDAGAGVTGSIIEEIENLATAAAVAALNDVSAADVNAQCDLAISDASLATAAALATVDTVVDAIKLETDKLTLGDAGAGVTGSIIEEIENLATAAAVAALNDLSAAQVNAECDTAISDAALATAAALATVQSDTDDIQTRIPAALVSGRMDSNVSAIDDTAAAAVRLALSAGQMIPGTVHNAVSPTTTTFEADDITEATADHYNGRIVLFTSGALTGQATDVTDYVLNGGIGAFTVTALTEAPSNDDTFILI